MLVFSSSWCWETQESIYGKWIIKAVCQCGTATMPWPADVLYDMLILKAWEWQRDSVTACICNMAAIACRLCQTYILYKFNK